MELARVGDPLVDQDQARPVLDEKLPQHVAGAGRVLVVSGDAGVRRRPAQLPRQLAPQRAHDRPVVLRGRIARRDAVAHQDDAPDAQRRRRPDVAQQRLHAGQLARGSAGAEVVQREHRMGLAAAEVGLQPHHRVAAGAGQPPHGAGQHRLQALGEVGAPEEFDRVAVLVGPLAEAHLPEVGGELRLLVPAARHVPVRRDHLAPRLQGGGRAGEGQAGLPAPFAARLLVEAGAQQLHLELLDVGRLRRRHRRQQPVRRVERAVGVVAGERLLVRPGVPVAAQLADEAALGRPEGRAEHAVPRLPHQLEERRHVPFGHRPLADVRVVDEGPQRRRAHPLRLDGAMHLALDERAEARLQQLERPAYPFVVGRGHGRRSPLRISGRARVPARPPRSAAGPTAHLPAARGSRSSIFPVTPSRRRNSSRAESQCTRRAAPGGRAAPPVRPGRPYRGSSAFASRSFIR